jgi:hypothetical protein
VDVGGIAGQQDVASTIGVRQPTLDTKRRRPFHGANGSAGLGGQPHPEVIDNRISRGLIAEFRWCWRHYPPHVARQRKDRKRHVPAQPRRRAPALQVDIGMHVGEQEALDDRHAGKSDAHGLTDDAVRAVGAHHPRGGYLGTVIEAHQHTVRTRLQSRHATAPLDAAAERGQPVAERALDVGLRHQQPARAAEAGRLPDREARELATVDVDGDVADRQASVGQIAERTEPIEHLDAAGLQAECSRGHRRPRGRVEHSHGDAGRPQPTRQREARRSRARHDDIPHTASSTVSP